MSRHLLRGAAVAVLATAAVATPQEADAIAFPVVLQGEACALAGALCGTGTFTFNGNNTGSSSIDVLGGTYSTPFQWRWNRNLQMVQVRTPDGTINAFSPISGCFTGTFTTGALTWDYTVCRVP